MSKTTRSDCNQIECPHCRAMETDLSDHSWDGECVEVKCDECRQSYLLCRDISVSYTAIPIARQA